MCNCETQIVRVWGDRAPSYLPIILLDTLPFNRLWYIQSEEELIMKSQYNQSRTLRITNNKWQKHVLIWKCQTSVDPPCMSHVKDKHQKGNYSVNKIFNQKALLIPIILVLPIHVKTWTSWPINGRNCHPLSKRNRNDWWIKWTFAKQQDGTLLKTVKKQTYANITVRN